MGGVHEVSHLPAPPALVARVAADQGAVAVQVDAVVGDGRQQVEVEVALPVTRRDLSGLREPEYLRVEESAGGLLGRIRPTLGNLRVP
jgi:hypothetical protein